MTLDSFYYTEHFPELAANKRPVWVVERGPGTVASPPVESQEVSVPGSAQTAYVNGVTNVNLHPVVFKWFIVNKPGASQLNGSTSDKIISLDPASAYDFFSIEVINQVFDTLLVYEPVTSKLLPGLATEIPTVANGGITNGGTTYTYHLRTGVTFSDGTALNSTVVKRSIDRAIRLDLPASAAFLLYDVGALRADHKGGNDTAAGTITTPDPNGRNCPGLV